MSSALRLPKERVQAIDPADLEAYLRGHGWELDPDVSSPEAAVYHIPSDPGAEVIIPRDKGFADYALRVGEALGEMAVMERRTAWEVLEDLSRKEGRASANRPAASRRGARNTPRRRKREAP
jgi:hypothetical protein